MFQLPCTFTCSLQSISTILTFFNDFLIVFNKKSLLAFFSRKVAVGILFFMLHVGS